MSYAMAGKIAGLGALRYGMRGLGLGDAAYDAALQAYASDHANWVLEKQAYDQNMAAWQQQVAQLNAAYDQANGIYGANLAQWQGEQAAYNAALTTYQNQSRTNQMTYGIQQNGATSQYPSIVIPPGYAGCVTAAQHASWQKTCDALQSVKGLGAAAPTGPECGLALLPVCATPIPAPAPVRPQPVPPARPNPPLAPPPLRPEPQPPAAAIPTPPPPQQPSPTPPPPSVLTPSYTVPDSLPIPTPSTTPTTKTASAGLLSNGLLLVVLAGGGYALYRTFKKPKKAA